MVNKSLKLNAFKIKKKTIFSLFQNLIKFDDLFTNLQLTGFSDADVHYISITNSTGCI